MDPRKNDRTEAELGVYHGARKVGILTSSDSGPALRFVYAPEWIVAGEGFPISHSLPLSRDVFVREAESFFANLLPEGGVREFLARRLGIGEKNDFGLLQAIGEDCAGALTIGPAPPRKREEKLEPITLEEIREFHRNTPSVAVSLLDAWEARLSLAGAQDKLAVRYVDGELLIPKHGAPSTHILKLPRSSFKNLIENEHEVGRLARAAGLPVPPSEVLSTKGFTALLIPRYDRVYDGQRWQRLHQEDLCQALVVPPRLKYESEGGPTFSQCFRVVETISTNLPEDLELLIRWLVFNVAVGNCDHHAKNLSLLRGADGRWALSPIYDLVCTRVYPGISTNLAMSIGGKVDGTNLNRRHWEALAQEIDFSAKSILRTLTEVTDAIESALAQTKKTAFQKLLRETILKQIKRTRLSAR